MVIIKSVLEVGFQRLSSLLRQKLGGRGVECGPATTRFLDATSSHSVYLYSEFSLLTRLHP